MEDKDIDTSVGEGWSKDEIWRRLRESVKSILKIEERDEDGEPAGMSPPMDWPEDEEYDRETGYSDPKENRAV